VRCAVGPQWTVSVSRAARHLTIATALTYGVRQRMSAEERRRIIRAFFIGILIALAIVFLLTGLGIVEWSKT